MKRQELSLKLNELVAEMDLAVAKDMEFFPHASQFRIVMAYLEVDHLDEFVAIDMTEAETGDLKKITLSRISVALSRMRELIDEDLAKLKVMQDTR